MIIKNDNWNYFCLCASHKPLNWGDICTKTLWTDGKFQQYFVNVFPFAVYLSLRVFMLWRKCIGFTIDWGWIWVLFGYFRQIISLFVLGWKKSFLWVWAKNVRNQETLVHSWIKFSLKVLNRTTMPLCSHNNDILLLYKQRATIESTCAHWEHSFMILDEIHVAATQRCFVCFVALEIVYICTYILKNLVTSKANVNCTCSFWSIIISWCGYSPEILDKNNTWKFPSSTIFQDSNEITC